MRPLFIKIVNWLRHFLTGTYYNHRNIRRTFPEFFEAASTMTYPIPGLKKTSAWNLANEKESCLAMTPQGMTLTENYLLISAYCHTHHHHSVIYVLDRFTGVRIKTVHLPDLPHAGGLAYDAHQRKIWLSNTAGKNAAVAAISLEQLENYSEDSPLISYQQKTVLKELPRASAITYDHGYLVAALFSLKNNGRIVCYPIDQNGNLKNSTNFSTGKRPQKAAALVESPFGTLAIPPKIQGVTFYINFLLLSQSWGKQPGKIYIFDIQQTTKFSDLQQAAQCITTPPYLEQIYVENDQLFALFESGAAAYRKKTPFVMKSVLQLDLTKLLDN